MSYYWMLPLSAVTATDTMNDGYYGSAIGTTSTTKIQNCYERGDYSGSTPYQAYVGGQWNKAKCVFNSQNNTEVRLFLKYYSEKSTGNAYMHLDEFMVYDIAYESDNSNFSSYSLNVSGENCYAYSSVTGTVEPDSKVSAVAAPKGGYRFDGWYEKGVKVSDNQLYTFNIQSNRTLVAKSVEITDSAAPITPDVNSSDSVDLEDVVALAQHVAGWQVENINNDLLDVNGDGEVNLNDVVLLAQHVAGWAVTDQFATTMTSALPAEDLTTPNLKSTVLAGENLIY